MQTVTIKQIANEFAESIGLDKYNRSRLPGTKERLQVSENTDGRFITGIDEKTFLLQNNPELASKVEATRLRLEAATGKDLSGTSPFWRTFYVTISSDEDLVLNFANAMHEVAYYALVANKYIAPDKDAISNPVYKDANYYAFTEESEIEEETNNRMIRDEAVVKLVGIKNNKNKMVLIGQYLEGIKFNDRLGENTLYTLLRSYIEQKDLKFARLFLSALELSTEEMQRKLLIDKAFKSRLIKTSKLANKKTIYQFGQVTLGSSIEEVYTNLADTKFSNELILIQNALENKSE